RWSCSIRLHGGSWRIAGSKSLSSSEAKSMGLAGLQGAYPPAARNAVLASSRLSATPPPFGPFSPQPIWVLRHSSRPVLRKDAGDGRAVMLWPSERNLVVKIDTRRFDLLGRLRGGQAFRPLLFFATPYHAPHRIEKIEDFARLDSLPDHTSRFDDQRGINIKARAVPVDLFLKIIELVEQSFPLVLLDFQFVEDGAQLLDVVMDLRLCGSVESDRV